MHNSTAQNSPSLQLWKLTQSGGHRPNPSGARATLLDGDGVLVREKDRELQRERERKRERERERGGERGVGEERKVNKGPNGKKLIEVEHILENQQEKEFNFL